MNLTDYPLDELKLAYRILHGQLLSHAELMDAQLLQDLQDYLQSRAKKEGIVIADHAQWDTWLGNAPVSCESRMAQRRKL